MKNFLSWFSVQNEYGKNVLDSDLEIDKIHVKYWKECIEKEKGKNQKLQLLLLNSKLKKILK